MRVDDGQFVTIFGVDQWITLRGLDSNNPALLIVSGPGAAFSRLAPFFEPWERAFTLAQWDQPGAGGTQAKNGDAGTGELTYARLARDGIAVAEFVCRRLRVGKIAVLGISGGSIVALMMVKQRPDLFFAYVGTGQIVDWARQETLSYARVLEQARALGNAEAVAELENLGPPPYPDAAADAVKSKYANTLTPVEQGVFASLEPAVMAAINSPPAGARYVPPGLPVLDVMTTAMAAYARLRDELVAFDARKLGLDFEVPMFFFQGDRDTFTVVSLVEGFVADIRAPQKALELIEGGGHSAFFVRDAFFELLVRFVKPLTGAKAD
jgi:pimeloyl-ACP methyl ester carboxylesterase